MQRIYSSANLIQIGQIKQILLDNGIESFIKNEHLAGGVGELPFLECWPELWVTDERFASRAQELIGAYVEGSRAPVEPWECPACREAIEGQFGSCWNCGQDREDTSDDVD